MRHSAIPLHEQIVWVASRAVHVWVGGAGVPVVMIHGSPGNAAMLRELAEAVATRFAVFAFDTPGFGDSDALPGDELTVTDLADAVAATMASLSLPPAVVFGTHTGAAIGLELARRHPGRVLGAVLEGVPVFSPDEQRALASDRYMPAFAADELGGHYARTWTRFRDQHVWFPWYQRDPAHLNEVDLGSAEAIHRWVDMYFRAAPTYRAPYRAAITYGDTARAAIAELSVPVTFTAEAADMLYPHLVRLGQLPSRHRIVRISDSHEREVRLLELISERARDGREDVSGHLPGTGALAYVHLKHGSMFVRRYGANGGPPVLLLHDAPGAGRSLERRAVELADAADVVLPDLPGCGRSASLGTGVPDLGAYADALSELLDAMQVDTPVSVEGNGIGAALALEFGRRHPQQVSRVTLQDLCTHEGNVRAEWARRIAPRITIADDGHHWYRTWLMLRDSLVYRPWFSHTRAALRRLPASFDADQLHAWTLDVMRNHASYHEVVDAVYAWSPAAARAALPPSVGLRSAGAG
jgi:pimeloyl-ACP methyl ester carboxylesterase